jgi:hypothetical protein
VTAELKWLSQNGFQECLQNLSVAGRSVYLYKWTFWKEIYVKWFYCFVFLRNKVILETFWD